MNSRLTLVAVGLAALSLAAPGCGKDDKDNKGKASTAGLSGKTGFAVLPADSHGVAGLAVSKITSSGIWKRYGTFAMIFASKELNKFKGACGFDPLTKVESVIVAGKAGDRDGVAVVKGVARKDAGNCAEKLAEADGEKVTISDDGNVMTGTNESGEAVHIGWLDDKTFLFAGEGKDKDRVKTLAGGGGGLDGNKEIMSLLGNVDTSAAIWGVFLNKTGENVGTIGAEAGYGSISLDGGFKLDAGLRQSNAEKAKEAQGEIEKFTGNFKATPLEKFTSKIKVKTNKSDVIVQLSLTDSEVDELVNTVRNNPDVLAILQSLAR